MAFDRSTGRFEIEGMREVEEIDFETQRVERDMLRQLAEPFNVLDRYFKYLRGTARLYEQQIARTPLDTEDSRRVAREHQLRVQIIDNTLDFWENVLSEEGPDEEKNDG